MALRPTRTLPAGPQSAATAFDFRAAFGSLSAKATIALPSISACFARRASSFADVSAPRKTVVKGPRHAAVGFAAKS